MSSKDTDVNSITFPNTVIYVNELYYNGRQSIDTADKQKSGINHVQDVCSFCSIIIESTDKVIDCEKCSTFFHASENCISLPMEVIDYLLQYKNSGLFYKCVNCRMQIKKEFDPLIDASTTGSESNTFEINDQQCDFDFLDVVCNEENQKNITEFLDNKGSGQNFDASEILYGENDEIRVASEISAIKVKTNIKETDSNLKVKRLLLPQILIKKCSVPENTQMNCKLLSNVSLPRKTLKRKKIISANRKKIFNCTFCNYNASKKKYLTEHLRIHHKPQISPPVTCDVCGKTFKCNITLEKHKTIHTGEKRFECNLCVKTFWLESSLETHKQIHTREKSFKCETCGSAFTDKGGLKRHVNSVHKKIRFNCNFCNSSFTRKSSLIVHMRQHTGGGEKLNCHLCDRSFNTSGLLQTHLFGHTGERPYKCQVCEYSAKDLSTLSKHTQIHSGINSFKCNYCDYSCRVKSILTIHVRTHTGEKPFKCSSCDYKAVSNHNLKRHIHRAHEVVKLFKCQHCSYSTHEKNRLESHSRIHTEEKPYSCPFCGHSAREKRHLQTHLRTHTGEKPYICNLCDYAAAQGTSLTIHIKTKHGNQYECTNTQQ